MSTTGNEASSGQPFGDAADRSAQEPTGGDLERRSNGKDERRRMSERLAEAAGAGETGRVPGMPNTSPWQRSNAVWHRAGIDWERAEPERPGARQAAGAPQEAAVYPAARPELARQPAPDDSDGAEPWGPSKRGRRMPTIPIRTVAIAAVAVVVVGGGAYALFSGGDGDDGTPKKPVAQGAAGADQLFAADPAAKTDGRAHTLAAVAASDRTVVMAGSEQGGVYSRGQFLVSGDSGRTWSVAQVRGADGGDPPQGEYPRLLAGGRGAWAALGGIALGRTPVTSVPWTSHDGRTWTRQAPSSAFVPGDRVDALARTRAGFVAVGTATVKNAAQAVVWTSGDGAVWTRLGADQLKPPPGGTVSGLSGVAANGDAVLAHGTLTTKTVTKKHGSKKKTTRTKTSEGFWRSPDGGRTWTPVSVPQADGSSGPAVAIAATKTGFFAVREGSQRTGKGKHGKKVRNCVVFGSPDGQKWAVTAKLAIPGYTSVAGLSGGDSGLTGLFTLSGDKTAVMTSDDGGLWHIRDTLPHGRVVTAAVRTSLGPVLAEHVDDGSAHLTFPGGDDVNLASVPGAVHPERTVAGIIADAGRTVAFGSTNGHPALWTSPNGTAWTRAALPAPASVPQRLTGAAHGPKGWLAVGGGGGRPVVVTSADGSEWRGVSGKAFTGIPVAAVAGGGSYVVVGRDGGAAAAWYSTDLSHWRHAGGAAKGDLGGGKSPQRVMNDVAAGSSGFVAVGAQTNTETAQPALWTSSDGKKWALSASPPALPQGVTEGALSRVVARGNTLVITGRAGTRAFAVVSSDGGRTWRPAPLPGADQDGSVTAATATPHGFVLVGTSGSDVMMWTSADGATWTASRPRGHGLDGPGVQRLTGVTVTGTTLAAVGFTGDYRGDGSTIWRPALP